MAPAHCLQGPLNGDSWRARARPCKRRCPEGQPGGLSGGHARCPIPRARLKWRRKHPVSAAAKGPMPSMRLTDSNNQSTSYRRRERYMQNGPK